VSRYRRDASVTQSDRPLSGRWSCRKTVERPHEELAPRHRIHRSQSYRVCRAHATSWLHAQGANDLIMSHEKTRWPGIFPLAAGIPPHDGKPVSACRRACMHHEIDLHIQLHVSNMMVLVLVWFLGLSAGTLYAERTLSPHTRNGGAFPSRSLLETSFGIQAVIMNVISNP